MSERTPNEVRALRQAFVAGVAYAIAPASPDRYGADAAAARYYPMPMVTVPRVVQDSEGVEWKVNEYWFVSARSAASAHLWTDTKLPMINRERMLILSDLLANPTETREAE